MVMTFFKSGTHQIQCKCFLSPYFTPCLLQISNATYLWEWNLAEFPMNRSLPLPHILMAGGPLSRADSIVMIMDGLLMSITTRNFCRYFEIHVDRRMVRVLILSVAREGISI